MRTYSLAYLTAATLSPPQAVDLAADLGYAAVGLRLLPSVAGGACQPLVADAALRRETLARMDATGVAVGDLEVVRLLPDVDIAACAELLDVGAQLRARNVLTIGEDPEPQRLADNFARLCEAASGHGLQVDLEFLPWTAVADARSAVALVERAGRPANAGVLVDPLHAARSSTTVADVAGIPRNLLHYAQVCDAPGGGPWALEQLLHTARLERLLPDEGVIPLRDLFGALPSDLHASVEIPHQVRMQRLGVREWARRALAASRFVLDGVVPDGGSHAA